MRSSMPKVLHPVCGRPMIAWPVLAAREAGAGRIVVIVSPTHDLTPGLPGETETVVQPEANGTGGAMRAAIDEIGESAEVVVLSGDHPLITAATIGELLESHRSAGAVATVMTVDMENPGELRSRRPRRLGPRRPDRRDEVPRARAGGDPRDEGDQHRHLLLRRPQVRHGPRRDHERQRGRRVLPRRRPAAASRGRRPCRRLQGHGPEREPGREQPRRPRARDRRGPTPDPRAPHAGRRHRHRSRVDLDRRRGRDRERRHDRTGHAAEGRDPDRRRLRRRPPHHRHRRPDRGQLARPALAPGRVRGRRRMLRSAPSPISARAPACTRGRRPAASSKSRTRRSERGPRCRTWRTSGTPTWAPAPTWAPGRSRRTTTAA